LGGEDLTEGPGVFSGEIGEAFAAGVAEARERTDSDFKRRADGVFEE
jgi:hypothetical protein